MTFQICLIIWGFIGGIYGFLMGYLGFDRRPVIIRWTFGILVFFMVLGLIIGLVLFLVPEGSIYVLGSELFYPGGLYIGGADWMFMKSQYMWNGIFPIGYTTLVKYLGETVAGMVVIGVFVFVYFVNPIMWYLIMLYLYLHLEKTGYMINIRLKKT